MMLWNCIFSPNTCAVQDHTLDRPGSPGVQALITVQISCSAWSLSHKIIWSECRDQVIHQYSEQKHKRDWKPQLFHSLLCAKKTSPARDYNSRKSRKPSCQVFNLMTLLLAYGITSPCMLMMVIATKELLILWLFSWPSERNGCALNTAWCHEALSSL